MAQKDLLGVDLFVHWGGSNPEELSKKMKAIENNGVELSMITNRGIKVWPDGFKETFCTDHWRCRFKPKENYEINKTHIVELMKMALNEKIDVIKTENLYSFDGVPAYSLGQGQ